MRLTELEPQFLRWDTKDEWRNVDTLAEAQGIIFLCPACFAKNGGNVGTHSVICWSRSRGVPDDATPGPGRWLLDGTGYGDLTLNEDGGSRSVFLSGPGCGWHGFVTNGEVTQA